MPDAIIPWEVLTYRVTLFFSKPLEIENLNWWSEITGIAPESRNLNIKMGSLQEFGEFNDSIVVLTLTAARADLNVQPLNKPDISLSLGRFPDGVKKMEELAKNWIQSKKNLNRLAIGYKLFHDVPNLSAGYEELKKLLHFVNLDEKESVDFNYQINRPHKSKVIPGQKINRLSKWMVPLVTLSAVDLAQIQNPVEFERVKQQKYTSMLELDVSTAQDSKAELDNTKIKEVFEELTHEAIEIGLKGDVK